MHSEALAATQTAGNAANRELLDGVQGLLNESVCPRRCIHRARCTISDSGSNRPYAGFKMGL